MQEYDGKVVLGLDFDTKNFDKKYAELLRRKEKEEIALNVKIENFEKTQEELELLKQEFDRFLEETQNNPIDTNGLPLNDNAADNLVTKQWQNYETSIDRLTAKLEKQRDEIAKQKNEYADIVKKVDNYQVELDKVDKTQINIPKNLDNVNKGLKDVIKKVSKWALAVFSIRSAYMLVRRAINIISSEDEEMALKVEYITYVIATALKPAIEWVVNMAFKLLSLIGGIIKAVFNVNIFAKATADGFAKAKNSANGLKKTLASFDEMNVVGGGGSGLLGDIKGALGDFDDLNDKIDKTSIKIKNLFKKIKQWFLGKGNNTLGEALTDSFKKFPENLKFILSPIYDYIIKPNLIDPIVQGVELLKPIWEPVVDEFEKSINEMKLAWQPFLDYINPNVIEPLKEKWREFKNDVSKTWNDTFKGLLPIIGPYINDIIYAINSVFGIFGVKLDYLKWDVEQTSNETKEDIKGALNDTSKKAGQTGNDIKGNIGGALIDTKQKAEDMSKPTYKVKVDTTGIASASSWLSNLWNKLKDLTIKPWKIALGLDVSNGSFGYGGGGGFRAKGGIYYPSKLPRLASGGIVNMPGPGVPYHGAVIGERGAEAVVPLTDSQQMDLLGASIGRHISITINNVTDLDGRQIAREVKKVSAESDFAFNR